MTPRRRPPAERVDVDALEAKVDLVALVAERVQIKRRGSEYVGLCPFHEEDSPSFTVNVAKGFVHCFGCGAHHRAVGFLMRFDGVDFLEACKRLQGPGLPAAVAHAPSRARTAPESLWRPLLPVPVNAPALASPGGRVRAWNPKLRRWSKLRPTRMDAYADVDGQLLGYVLRLELPERKIHVTATWCERTDGARRWCLQAFPEPRPLQGLPALAVQIATIEGPTGHRRVQLLAGEQPALEPGEWVARMGWRPVLVVEGEKCREAAHSALPHYAVLTWPGGGNGVAHADWSPLAGRDVVLWEDADEPGRAAMRGRTDAAGDFHPGVAQLAHAAGARSVRAVDPSGMPGGWDVADALDPKKDAWTPQQLVAWASGRVAPVETTTPTIERPDEEIDDVA